MRDVATVRGTTVHPTPSPTKRYTREIRQRIIREFAARHDGIYDAKLFELEVRKAGKKHEAYDWFDWDDTHAALEYRIYQAREFAVGLKVVFRVEELGRGKVIRIIERDAPFVLSPLATRGTGGGYYVTDPDNPEHMEELCLQAITAFRGWAIRYSVAAAHKNATGLVQKLLEALER